ncbi:MAG TPA: pathogenicity-like protein, partial [Xanthomonadaceae bacterium]|nr:pathogenicity-like protein [Xanthomonadaceae bacterium]
MRKIFSSQRVETAEGVANLLREAGIEIRLTNARSYHSKRSGQFSYLDRSNAQAHPTVWVVHANDQPRARELLREARLLDTTRQDLPNARYAFGDDLAEAAGGGRNWAWRIRIGLLLVIGAIAMFVVMRHRAAPSAPPP